MQKKGSLGEISVLELVAINYPDSNKNTENQQSLC